MNKLDRFQLLVREKEDVGDQCCHLRVTLAHLLQNFHCLIKAARKLDTLVEAVDEMVVQLGAKHVSSFVLT